MARPNPLVERWLSDEGGVLSEEVLARLIARRSLDDLGLARHEGRWDLRYLPLPIAQRRARFETQGWFVEHLGGFITLRGARLEGLDLTGAQLRHVRTFDTTIEDCLFDKAVCHDWRMWNTRFQDCSFTRADLSQAVLGSWHEQQRNEWRRVDFTGADLRDAVCGSALLQDCDFSRAKLNGLTFSQCEITRCRFAGTLRNVTFDGRPLEGRASPRPLADLDLSAATLHDVTFRGYLLNDVRFPDDPELQVVHHFRCIVEHSLRQLDGVDSDSARVIIAIFENELKAMRADDEDFLINRHDFRSWAGQELLDLTTTTIAAAQTHCGHN